MSFARASVADSETTNAKRSTKKARSWGDIIKVAFAYLFITITLPLSPIYLLLALCYQGCYVHGKLSPLARVVTTVVCVFFAIAWIPFANLVLYYLELTKADRNVTSNEINGLAPIATLVIFWLWGTVVTYRYYSIDDAYEQERDRRSVQRLKDYRLRPPIRCSPPKTATGLTALLSLDSGTDSDDERDLDKAAAHATPDGGSDDFAATQALLKKGKLEDAFDLFLVLKRQSPYETVTALVFGLGMSAVTVTAARVFEYTRPPQDVANNPGYFKQPLYILSTIYFSGMFFVFYTALAFVVILYRQHTRLVFNLTFMAKGSDPLDEGFDEDDDHFIAGTVGGAGAAMPNRVLHDSIRRQGSDMFAGPPMRNSRVAQGIASDPTNYGGEAPPKFDDGQSASMLSRIESMEGTPRFTSADSGRGMTRGGLVEELERYNLSHIHAWDECRRVAVDQIASPNSVLNSFFTPTIGIAVLGFIGLFSYVMVRLLFTCRTQSSKDDDIEDMGCVGPFFIVSACLLLLFAIYLVVIVYQAKRTRRHFKYHDVVIAKIAFDVARELDHFLSEYQRYNHDNPVYVKQLEFLFNSVTSLRALMEATSPRPLILGIEQRHVRYAVTYLLIASSALLFFSLLNALHRCPA